MSAAIFLSSFPRVLEQLERFVFHKRRTPRQVLDDLRETDQQKNETKIRHIALSIDDPLSCMGLFEKAEREQFLRKERIVTILPFVVLGIIFAAGIVPLKAVPPFLGLGFGVTVITRGIRRRGAKEKFLKAIEFHLPMVMERLVMAVQAGLDILPAVRTVLKQEHENINTKNPAEKLLLWAYRLTNSGQSFEESLTFVASAVESSALRHAFIHLGVAHREGGELTSPLRELSDSTQAYYQESVEEEIAKLPVKATLPLLLTFAGLIATFLAPPLVQLIVFSAKTVGGQ